MNWSRVLQIAQHVVPIIGRWWAGGILCFFAFAPGWILFHILADIIGNPRSMLDAKPKDLLLGLGVLALCGSLTYFLLLLAYRSITGRGRKKDGGLLPPFAMQIFAALFALCGAAVSALGIERQAYVAVFAGLFEFLIGVGVFRLSSVRRRMTIRRPAE
jgi:hypothetical protein